jgi:hypothetical protein
MPKLAAVLKANNVEVVVRQELDNGEWLLMIAAPGAVSFPSPVYPNYILYAETRDPVDISDEIAEAVRRRFNPPLLSGFKKT